MRPAAARLLPLLALLLLAARPRPAAAHVESWAVAGAGVGRTLCRPMHGAAAVPGGQPAYARVDVTTRPPEPAGRVSIAVFAAADKDAIGVEADGGRAYICDGSAATRELCGPGGDDGRFVVQPRPQTWAPIVTRVFNANAGAAGEHFSLRYPVERTGEYCVDVFNYMGSSSAGVIEWRNPYGELPAVDYPKLPFYGLLALTYLAYALVWLVLSVRYWRDILPLQNFIGGVVVFLAIEMAFNYGYYENYNKYGTSSTFLLIVVVVLNSARNSISFLLLLVVSLGYGVVRPTLGATMRKCLILTYTHFVCNTVYVAGAMVAPEVSGPVIFLFIFPLAGTLTAFYIWTFNALTETRRRLAERRQAVKLRMYTILWRVLLFSFLNLFVFLVANTIDAAHRSDWEYYSRTWQWKWFIIDGWLNLLYLLVFTMILVLWRPTVNNQRYGLEQLANEDDDSDEGGAGSGGAGWQGYGQEIKLRNVRELVADDEDDDDTRGVVFDADAAAAAEQGHERSPIGNPGGAGASSATSASLTPKAAAGSPSRDKLHASPIREEEAAELLRWAEDNLGASAESVEGAASPRAPGGS